MAGFLFIAAKILIIVNSNLQLRITMIPPYMMGAVVLTIFGVGLLFGYRREVIRNEESAKRSSIAGKGVGGITKLVGILRRPNQPASTYG